MTEEQLILPIRESTQLDPYELAHILRLPAPTSQQAAIIAAPLTPSSVVAGAGSGKTETMAARVVWLIANGHVEAGQVLGLTFTRKAARELATRIRLRLRTFALARHGHLDRAATLFMDEPTVLTYDAYARRIVTEHGLRIGVEPSATIADAGTVWQLAYNTVAHSDARLEDIDRAMSTIVDALVELSESMASHLVSIRQLLAFIEPLRWHLESIRLTKDSAKVTSALEARMLLAPLIDRLQKHKAEREVVSFSDIMRAACQLVQQFGQIGELERSRFGVVLLDEYQDTSHAQAQFLAALYAGHPVSAVGDPCQAIYSFRGASEDTLSAFGSTFAAGAVSPTYPLATSFRNGTDILRLANNLSEPLRNGAVPVAMLEPADGAATGTVSVAMHATLKDEAQDIVDRILALYGDAEKVSERPSAAVLCRVKDQFRPIAEALRAHEIPYEIVGLAGLMSVPEIADIIAILRVLDDPDAGTGVVRLLSGPRWRLGPRDLLRLSEYAHQLSRVDAPDATIELTPDEVDGRSLVEAIDAVGQSPVGLFSPVGRRRLIAFASQVRALRREVGSPLADLVASVERAIGVDIEVTVRDLRLGLQPRAQLDQFIAVASRFSSDTGSNSLTAFLRYLDAAEAHDRGLPLAPIEPRPGAVQIMTVHAAKGLEWDVVFVPGVLKGKFPATPDPAFGWLKAMHSLPYPLRGDRAAQPRIDLTSASTSKELTALIDQFKTEVAGKHELDERRLFYVAVTRARMVLHVSGAYWRTGKNPQAPSSFMLQCRDVIDRGLLRQGTVGDWPEPPEKGTINPAYRAGRSAAWPVTYDADRVAQLQAAAQLVRSADTDQSAQSRDALSDQAKQWREDTELLIAQRRARAVSGGIEVQLPSRLSATQLVSLHADESAFAVQLRRPVPARPSSAARRGTAFHAWLERRFDSTALLELDELPGSGDEGIVIDEALDDLIEAFERSEWANREPFKVEVPFDIAIAGVPVRGRLDAVYRISGDQTERFEVVDWKTGSMPTGGALRAAEVQLAVYRIAWSQIAAVALDDVSAAFHYVPTGRTHRPVQLLSENQIAHQISAIPLTEPGR